MVKAKLYSVFIMLIMVAGLIGPVGLVSGQALAKAHTLLTQLAAEQPDQLVAVIVQKLAKDMRLEALVVKLGGKVTRDLHIINAFAAEMEAQAALALARDPGVRWVSLDAPVERSSTSSSAYVYDTFPSASFSNNNGTANWSTPWQEQGESNGTGVGYVKVAGTGCAYGQCLYLASGKQNMSGYGASRQADLRQASEATLTFSYRRRSYSSSNASVRLEASPNGGASWTTLAEYPVTASDGGQVSQTFDLTAYLGAATRIRFAATGKVDGYFTADNIKISYTSWQNQFLDTAGVTQAHAQGLTGQGVSVAVIDSGVAYHADLSNRLLQPVGFAEGDSYGHGTHVAGILAGDGNLSGSLYKGVAPGAQVINLNIMDAFGMAYESDVVEALQWVYDNRTAYNIRVVNM